MKDARIAIPRKTKDPDWGLLIEHGRFKVRFKEDGKHRQFTLKSATTVEEARILRDRFFANLKRKYETKTISSKPGRRPRRGMKGIYQRKPFYVKIEGKQIGEYDTLKEAKDARDKALGKP